MSNCTHNKLWDEITYLFQNCNCVTAAVWEWISKLISQYRACDYLSIPELKLSHVNKPHKNKGKYTKEYTDPRWYNRNTDKHPTTVLKGVLYTTSTKSLLHLE